MEWAPGERKVRAAKSDIAIAIREEVRIVRAEAMPALETALELALFLILEPEGGITRERSCARLLDHRHRLLLPGECARHKTSVDPLRSVDGYSHVYKYPPAIV
jgi:hypothetical protein